MSVERQLRIGSVCALLYVAVFIFMQVYLPQLIGNATLPTETKGKLDQYVGALLAFAHRHGAYFAQLTLFSALDYVLLAGAMFAMYVLLRSWQRLAARIALAVGVIGLALAVIGQSVETNSLLDYAGQYSRAASAAAQLAVVHRIENQGVGYQIMGFVGLAGIAIWLALNGIIFLRTQGSRSLIAWGTLAAGLLLVTGLPTLPVWALGAGIGLWRLSNAPYALNAQSSIIEDTPVMETRTERDAGREREELRSTARRARQQAATAHGAKRRKRR